MLLTRAALLARLGRFDETEQVIASLGGPHGHEPARYRWGAALPHYRRQELLLRTALAERRGDWTAAAQAWARACKTTPIPEALQWARKLFAAQAELGNLPSGSGWRQATVQATRDQALQRLSSIPLIGDALFFRAAALCDTQPDRALKDLQTLLRQRTWLEQQQRSGGGRLLALGDLLLRLGRVDEAVHAWERGGDSAAIRERCAVALVSARLRDGRALDRLEEAVERAAALAGASPWPHLLAALGLLAAGRADEARARVEVAEQHNAPPALCRCLRALATRSIAEAVLEERDLSALQLSPEVDAVLRVLCGPGTEAARLALFVRILGERWLALCPTDPAASARRLLAAGCDDGNWPEALAFARTLTTVNQPWATELATLVRLRHALERAAGGELEEAEQELQRLENE
jgi:hypothetical protein